MAKECTLGLMGDNSMVIGRTIKCMALVFSDGQMEDSMKENILMIRRKVVESSLGQMVESMMENG